MKAIKRLTGAFSTAWRRSDEDYYQSVVATTMEELRRANLSGKCFHPEDYAAAVGRYSGLHLPIGSFRELENPLLAAKLRELGLAGAAIPEPESDTVWIALPESLTGIVRREIAFHELSHVACAHSFEPRYLLDGTSIASKEDAKPWRAPRKFTLGESRQDDEGREREANFRAMALVEASIYGPKMVNRPEHFMGLRHSRFPILTGSSRLQESAEGYEQEFGNGEP